MDYRDYVRLQKRYRELDNLVFGKGEAKQEIIDRLIQASHEKKEIRSGCNDIIREYILKYEKNPEEMDDGAVMSLRDFMESLFGSGSFADMDVAVAFRIARLLLRYYQEAGDKEHVIEMLKHCSVFDLVMKEHLNSYEGSVYPLMAERYLEDFDSLSERAQGDLVDCWFWSAITREDIGYAINRYKEVCGRFAEVCRKKGKDFLQVEFAIFRKNMLTLVLKACFDAERAEKDGISAGKPMIGIEEARSCIEELKENMCETLEAENWQQIHDDRVESLICITLADYYLGRISVEELLVQIEKYIQPQEDYNNYNQFMTLFSANSFYLDYLNLCDGYDREYITDKSTKIIEYVTRKAKELNKGSDNYETNMRLLAMVKSASAVVDFDMLQDVVLSVTVYADRALYAHTLMVRELSCAILSYILEHDWQYTDGVGGYSARKDREYRDKMMKLMEKCALFHDIGKYFCLDYVSNSSRDLTEEEFRILKEHPSNFSRIYEGKMNRETQCVRDCALLHHVWYNEAGGYPPQKHTVNKPFVNILSIADSIDAAMDYIGRPYGQGKSFAQLLDEFEGMKDIQYSGYVCGLLRAEELRARLEHILEEKRKDIYCKICAP